MELVIYEYREWRIHFAICVKTGTPQWAQARLNQILYYFDTIRDPTSMSTELGRLSPDSRKLIAENIFIRIAVIERAFCHGDEYHHLLTGLKTLIRVDDESSRRIWNSTEVCEELRIMVEAVQFSLTGIFISWDGGDEMFRTRKYEPSDASKKSFNLRKSFLQRFSDCGAPSPMILNRLIYMSNLSYAPLIRKVLSRETLNRYKTTISPKSRMRYLVHKKIKKTIYVYKRIYKNR